MTVAELILKLVRLPDDMEVKLNYGGKIYPFNNVRVSEDEAVLVNEWMPKQSKIAKQ